MHHAAPKYRYSLHIGEAILSPSDIRVLPKEVVKEGLKINAAAVILAPNRHYASN